MATGTATTVTRLNFPFTTATSGLTFPTFDASQISSLQGVATSIAASLNLGGDPNALSPGAAAGIGVGVGVFVLLVAAGITFFLLRRRKRRRQNGVAKPEIQTAAEMDGKAGIYETGGTVRPYEADTNATTIHEADGNALKAELSPSGTRYEVSGQSKAVELPARPIEK